MWLSKWESNALTRSNHLFTHLIHQLKMNHTKESAKSKVCGQYSGSTTSDHVMFTICSINAKPYQENYMTIFLSMAMLMVIWLQNGRRWVIDTNTCLCSLIGCSTDALGWFNSLDSNVYVAWGAYKQKILILVQLVFADCPKQSWRKERSLNVFTVAAEVVQVETRLQAFHSFSLIIMVQSLAMAYSSPYFVKQLLKMLRRKN
jgi:hypothetical protein